MTEQQFLIARALKLKDIPKEFHDFLSDLAWDVGHAHGYEEVLNYIGDFAFGFQRAFDQYKKAKPCLH